MCITLKAHSEFGLRMAHVRPQVNRTLDRSLSRIVSQPGKSFSRSLGESLRKSCSNGLSHPHMNTAAILSGHYHSTSARVKESKEQVLVIAQDTVILNLHSHKAMAGLKPFQDKILGLLQHNALCVEANSGLPLGLVHVHNWTRKGYQSYEVESQKWFEPLVKSNALAEQNQDKRFVLVQDREADIYSFFTAHRADNLALVTRVFQNRKYELVYDSPSSGPVHYLKEVVKHLEVLGHHQIEVYRNRRNIRLELALQAAPVKVYQTNKKGKVKGQSQLMYLVSAQEIGAFDKHGKSIYEEDQATQWLLLTNLKVEQLQEAKAVCLYYSRRWQVERLHYTMKSGALQVERLQFDDVQTFCNALGLYTIAAWRIYRLQKLAMEHPQEPADQYFDATERAILEIQTAKSVQTVEHAVQALGKLVDFVPRKKQSLPGIKILAEALTTLQALKNLWHKLKPKHKP